MKWHKKWLMKCLPSGLSLYRKNHNPAADNLSSNYSVSRYGICPYPMSLEQVKAVAAMG